MKKVSINSFLCVAPASKDELLDFISSTKGILVALNAEKIARREQALVDLTWEHVAYPDGIGAVWCCRQKGANDAVKIPGCELWLEVIERFCETKTVYFLGANPNTLKAAIGKLNDIYPRLKIIGSQHGYFDLSSENDVIENVVAKAPDIVFVALGSPRQEYLMKKMFDRHPAIYQGLGGSLDVFVGNVPRAPMIWQRLNIPRA